MQRNLGLDIFAIYRKTKLRRKKVTPEMESGRLNCPRGGVLVVIKIYLNLGLLVVFRWGLPGLGKEAGVNEFFLRVK